MRPICFCDLLAHRRVGTAAEHDDRVAARRQIDANLDEPIHRPSIRFELRAGRKRNHRCALVHAGLSEQIGHRPPIRVAEFERKFGVVARESSCPHNLEQPLYFVGEFEKQRLRLRRKPRFILPTETPARAGRSRHHQVSIQSHERRGDRRQFDPDVEPARAQIAHQLEPAARRRNVFGVIDDDFIDPAHALEQLARADRSQFARRRHQRQMRRRIRAPYRMHRGDRARRVANIPDPVDAYALCFERTPPRPYASRRAAQHRVDGCAQRTGRKRLLSSQRHFELDEARAMRRQALGRRLRTKRGWTSSLSPGRGAGSSIGASAGA